MTNAKRIPVASLISLIRRCIQSQSTHIMAFRKFFAKAAPLGFSDPLSKDRVSCNHFPHKVPALPHKYHFGPCRFRDSTEARPVWQVILPLPPQSRLRLQDIIQTLNPRGIAFSRIYSDLPIHIVSPLCIRHARRTYQNTYNIIPGHSQ